VVFPKQYLIDQTEYQIRKTERGIKVLYTCGADSKQLLAYGEKREKLMDQLEKLTEEKYFSAGCWKVLKKGRREPLYPEWPL